MGGLFFTRFHPLQNAIPLSIVPEGRSCEGGVWHGTNGPWQEYRAIPSDRSGSTGERGIPPGPAKRLGKCKAAESGIAVLRAFYVLCLPASIWRAGHFAWFIQAFAGPVGEGGRTSPADLGLARPRPHFFCLSCALLMFGVGDVGGCWCWVLGVECYTPLSACLYLTFTPPPTTIPCCGAPPPHPPLVALPVSIDPTTLRTPPPSPYSTGRAARPLVLRGVCYIPHSKCFTPFSSYPPPPRRVSDYK